MAVHTLFACRLLDLYDDGALSFAAIQAVAIDECDKMLSLGFSAQLDRLASLLLHDHPGGATGSGDAMASGTGNHRKQQRQRDVALVPQPAVSAQPAGLPACRPQVLLFSATAAAAANAAIKALIADDAMRIDVKEGHAEQVSKTVTQVRSTAGLDQMKLLCSI